MPRKHAAAKRPPFLNLILAYTVVITMLDVLTMAAIGGAITSMIVGLALKVAAIYFGLWLMQRIWMWILTALLLIGAVASVMLGSILGSLPFEAMVTIVLNVLAAAWLIRNRKLFKCKIGFCF